MSVFPQKGGYFVHWYYSAFFGRFCQAGIYNMEARRKLWLFKYREKRVSAACGRAAADKTISGSSLP